MTKKQKRNLYRILLSLGLFILCLVLPFPENGPGQLFAFLVPFILCGWDVLRDAFLNIIHGQVLDEKFLMTAASVGSFALGEYTEAVAVMLFYQVGEWFQGIAVGRSRKNIAALMDIRPDTARVLRGGEEEEVSPDEVAAGEEIVVRPGERVPLDGVILEGAASVDTAALTGESAPRDLGVSDTVLSGSINLSGVIRVRTTSAADESTVSRILELVENATDKKAPVENFITRFSRIYTPAVVISAVLLACVPPLFFSGVWADWIYRALTFLVVSCPCALLVSVPLSFFGGIGGASRHGILIKGAGYMEVLAKIRTAVFDKTGTLTRGSFAVTDVHPSGVTPAELIDLAALAEAHSSHPIALSILAAHEGHIDRGRVTSIEEISGLGIRATIDGKDVLAGSSRLMDRFGVAWRLCGEDRGTVIHMAADGEYLGHIIISDSLKEDAPEALDKLRAMGVEKVVVLTGDTREAAEHALRDVKADLVVPQLLPQDKVARVEGLLSPGKPLCFVGDGINDAPVLVRADLGIAMGAMGSDAAIEAADIVLMDDSLSRLPLAMAFARKTMSVVRQNIAFSLAVKGAVLLLGALGVTGMGLAVFADVGVLCLVILNAMRCLKAPRV